MTPELWQRLKPLYEAALETPTAERVKFIEEVSQGDSLLKEELEKLLKATTDSGESFDSPLFRLGDLIARNHTILSEGELLLCRFRIIRHLGSGGMGDVYEAHDQELQMGRVALKTIRPSIAKSPAILSRFKEEVILARRVSGPHVCRIHELFVLPKQAGVDCAAFLTMERLEGTTLSDRIKMSGPLPLQQALVVALQLCAALQAIHDAGVIHRDLKPRNIMLVPHMGSEKAVVMDFGLAHVVATKSMAEETGHTLPGVIMGTPEYMAPEQFEGCDASPATDIYALGLVLYELVTGKQLFAASTPFAAAVRRGKRPDSSLLVRRGIPSVWDDVIAKCLEFDAELRYQSAAEVIHAFHQHRLVIWRFRQGQRISLARKSLVTIIAGALLAMAAATLFMLSNPFSYHMSSEVKYWYDLGVNDLGEGTYLNATSEFERAIQLDRTYPLTHARLAEAWNELDFAGEAQQQMLYATAPRQQHSLSKVERMYLDAVRTTLIGDFHTASLDYEAIEKFLPRRLKSEGLVDLGRAYEKDGRTKEALQKYQEAARLNSNNPAAFLHQGILMSRLSDSAGANNAFNLAENFYRDHHNQEGVAEVNFRRGYAANENFEFDSARKYLAKAMEIAKATDDDQLRVRVLSQMSSVEYNSTTDKNKDNDKKAIAYAEEEGSLSDKNRLAFRLEYWSTDSLMRLGNAYLDEERYSDAETTLVQALAQAKQRKYARLEAFVNLTLASLYDQEGKQRVEQISHAQMALKYFEQFGYRDHVREASTLILRAREQLGNLTQNLQSAKDLLRQASEEGNKESIAQAKETLGSVLSGQEQYLEALEPYQEAVKTDQEIGLRAGYNQVGCAEVLWHLGRFPEASAMLDSISDDEKTRHDIGSGVKQGQAHIQLNQRHYREALVIAQDALKQFPDVTAEKIADLEAVASGAEAQLGHIPPARQHADNIATLARRNYSASMMAQAQLAYARVDLQAHSSLRAFEEARDANRYYTERNLLESQWLSLAFMARAARDSGDMTGAKKYAKNALDNLAHLEQTWDSPTIKLYELCPDYQIAKSELKSLCDRKEA
ncbi:MAG TPA: protein kinase [Acidobacteriaceae bacterium]|nr:protein kinase [Acidobacteriaceae bacterium]